MSPGSDVAFERGGGEAWRDPFPMYRELRDRAPLLEVPSGDYWVLSRWQDVFDALTTYPDEAGAAALLVAIGPLIDMDVLSAPDRCNPDAWEAWTLLCMPTDTEPFATFYVPRELRLLMSAEFEGGQPTGFAMGAVSAAFHTGAL